VTTAAIILAAGASHRMGRNKMLLRIDGESLVRRAVSRAVSADFAPTVVVVGHESDKVRTELSGLPCSFVTNPDYTGPTSESFHRGLEAIPGAVDATVVVLADMPFVTSGMLVAVAAAARDRQSPLAASRYGDVLAPPLFFRRSLFAELLAWHGEGCGKQVVLKHQHEAAVVEWPVEALADIDTPEDFATMTQRAR
jgi:molybdenum cofactor cytidylyltransferase